MVCQATEVVIIEPPAAPVANTTSPLGSKTIAGHIDDNGLFPAIYKIILNLLQSGLVNEDKKYTTIFAFRF